MPNNNFDDFINEIKNQNENLIVKNWSNSFDFD